MKKSIGTAILVAISLRLASMAGALDAAGTFLREISADGRLLTVSLGVEFGSKPADTPSPDGAGLEAEAGGLYVASPVIRRPEPSAASETSETLERQILPATIPGGLKISNATSFSPDIEALMNEPLGIRLPSEGPQILIIHTHGSEAYTPEAFDRYETSDSFRTQDKEYNVIRVGDELASELEQFGLRILHDREIYDYPSYTGSYSRSGAAVDQYLAEYPGIAIVIDLHRDALGSGDVVYKTMANLQGETSSQLMLLVGTGENGLYHPYWQENLKLALRLQAAAERSYPTLARPIALKQERYNQQLSPGMLILEVGSNGNTLREALCAVRLFAKAIGSTLKELIT